jgi:hypothetical protein
MKLDPKEARLIAELRGTPTGKVTVSKFGGEIRSIRTEIDAELADKARGQAGPWSVPRGTVPGETETKKISEPLKRPGSIAKPDEIRTREA